MSVTNVVVKRTDVKQLMFLEYGQLWDNLNFKLHACK
jgi:hypothetical protein